MAIVRDYKVQLIRESGNNRGVPNMHVIVEGAASYENAKDTAEGMHPGYKAGSCGIHYVNGDCNEHNV